MSKYEQRLQARSMRRDGTSVIVIARKLSVSRSSVSVWCRDIVLTEEQFEKLSGVSVKTGQRMGAEANKRKKLEAIKNAEEWGKKLVKNISQRELMLIAAGLYWCEGSKTDTSSSFMFVNSDPEMIVVMKNFLIDVIKVDLKNIGYCVQINRIHEPRIKEVLIFWQKLLNLQSSQMRKPYFVNTKVHKVYENYDKYYGVCRLFVRKSKNLKYQMNGLVKAIKEDILSA